MPSPPLAKNVTIDTTTGHVYIDGRVLGAAIDQDFDIDLLDPCGHIARVTIGILADNARVLRSLADDLQWIRDVADQHRRELGLAVPA